MTELKFRVGPIRPPSEANSLLIQVTRGCTWNKCKFCNLYRHTKFKAYSAESIKEDIDNIARLAELINKHQSVHGWDVEALNRQMAALADEEERQSYYMVANWLISGGENVFLQDGNTTALSNGKLSDVLIYLKSAFPQIKRITSYGRAENLAKSTAEEFAELKEAGLDRIHSGFESGSDEVLRMINKGVTQEQEIAAGRAIKAGGIELSIYFMPGIGGKALSLTNAEETAKVINAICPDFVRVRTAAIKEGTELHEDLRHGKFKMCSDDEKVDEIRRVLELVDVPGRIVSDHMINLLQGIEGAMTGEEREGMLSYIDEYRNMPEDMRRLYQLLRRTLRAYEPEDVQRLTDDEISSLKKVVLECSQKRWDEKMNEYICRFI